MTLVRINQRRERSTTKAGFTLVEVLVAMAILLVVMLILLQITLGMTKLWQTTSGTVSDFQSARLAFATINRVLARATTHTHLDYIDTTVAGLANAPFGAVRTVANAATFTISTTTPIARASELHFVSGLASTLLGQTAANAPLYPGDAVFFQAPLGFTNTPADKQLNRALNSVGFYIQYSTPSNLPAWLNTLFGPPATSPTYRFRLIEAIQPTENFDLYTMTSTGSYNGLAWLPLTPGSSRTETTFTTSVLAENVLLLIIRPRLDPQDEVTAGALLGTPSTAANKNSIISPTYNYDSRAWESGYTTPVLRTGAVSQAQLMRNQLPPIVDVAMICADNASLVRFQNPATPPSVLQPTGLFTLSANLDANLATYEQNLSAAHVRFRLFRSSIDMQSSSWSNN